MVLLNKMYKEEGLDYKSAIKAEDKKFNGRRLKERQEKVKEGLEKEYHINLTNKKEGGTEEMKSTKDVVKLTETANTKAVTPKVDVNTKEVEEKAEGFLKELEAELGDVKYELERVHIGLLKIKSNNRFIFGIRYSICGNKVTYSFVARENYKNFSKQLQGKYSPGNWNILFPIDGNGIKKFSLIIGESSEKYRAKAKPVAKVAKPAPKKNKPIRRHI